MSREGNGVKILFRAKGAFIMSFERINQLLNEAEAEILHDEENLKIIRSLNDNDKNRFSEKYHEARQVIVALRGTLRRLNDEIMQAIRENNQNP